MMISVIKGIYLLSMSIHCNYLRRFIMLKKIKIKWTQDYPTRFVAFKNQQTLVLQINHKLEGGYEYAVYSHRVKNSYWPRLIDGLFASIESSQGKWYIVEIHLTLPNKERQQLGFTKAFDDYQEALETLKQGIEKYEEILKEVINANSTKNA